MISILIPVYNYDITFFVNCLSNAIADLPVYEEIIIGSDGSDAAFVSTYRELAKLENVKLLVSKENVGRAAICNMLAEKSIGSHLLYIDADALVLSDAKVYLTSYSAVINKAPVICGGVSYRKVPPDDPDRYLRWHYGYYKEQKSARKRNRNPYASFSGFNFLVEKAVLSRIKFDAGLKKYGHEDTLFAYQLMKAKISILHIDNPLVHDGIEPNRIFILKTQEGVHNLSILYDRATDKKEFASSVRLLKLYSRLRIIGIPLLLSKYYTRNRRKIEIMLRSRKCSLKIFSIYKLGLFCYYRYNPTPAD